MNKKLAAVGLLCAFMAACGGSGDEDATGPTPSPAPAPTPAPAPAPQASPEGFWVGRASTGTDVFLAVLDDGKTWGLYESDGYIVGALVGQTSYSGTSLSGSGRDFNLLSRTVSPGTYAGTFSTKSYVDVSLSNGSTFTGSYGASYDQPASQSAVAGTFSGTGVTGTTLPQAATISVASSGEVTMSPAQGCGGSGSVKPRASGKNVYDVTITFQGDACALGNGVTVRGIAVYDTAQRRLWALAANSAQTDGFIYAAIKN
ncbi:MAG: hypothetical protein QM772_11600 [Ottowia sp.]|uniref:hypothetical protein n=1 Tax=Ottowia sp. TaxID=1898956 RepID=UPI0039E22FA4